MAVKTSLLLALLPLLSSARVLRARQGVECDFQAEAQPGDNCASFSDEWGLTQSQFVALNPGVQCPNLVVGQSYCVSGTAPSGTGGTTPTPTTSMPKTTSSPPATTSAAHQPQQSGLASNCNNFYQVASGDSCSAIEAKYGISASEFSSWNPSINSQCTNLLVGYYVCVGVPGAKTTSSAPAPKTTTPTNGISTPAPIQTGMVSNCNKFYDVQSGDSCDAISKQYNIPLSKFYSWNPAVGSTCANLDVGDYVCVDVVGYTPPTTTTTAGNGISTPTPIQSGMVSNCNQFYQVKSGDSCQPIASSYNIPLNTFYSWNPSVGSNCQYLDVGYYVCVDTVGYTHPTTTTSKGNGVATPTPYEPGMVSNCNRFYYVQSGNTCASISQNQGVSVAQIEKWNPTVGSDCSHLYLHDYICTGVQ